MATTTIQIDKDLKASLDGLKLHPRETYNDTIQRILEDLRELNEETLSEIKAALEAIKQGRYRTHEQLQREMGF